MQDLIGVLVAGLGVLQGLDRLGGIDAGVLEGEVDLQRIRL